MIRHLPFTRRKGPNIGRFLRNGKAGIGRKEKIQDMMKKERRGEAGRMDLGMRRGNEGKTLLLANIIVQPYQQSLTLLHPLHPPRKIIIWIREGILISSTLVQDVDIVSFLLAADEYSDWERNGDWMEEMLDQEEE
jgi:hypothetical protein